ncbi:hypothetical protein ES703_26876 [subsurface metagenome]
MNEQWNSRLEEALEQIEFPGEDEQELTGYLKSEQFVDRVMERTINLSGRSQKTIFWALFALLNLLLLFILGINNFIVHDFFALQNALCQFFFLFLGLTLLGSLIGLVLSIDTSWFDHLLHRDV